MLKSALTTLVLSALAATPAIADNKLMGVDIKPQEGQFVGAPRINVERKDGKLVGPSRRLHRQRLQEIQHRQRRHRHPEHLGQGRGLFADAAQYGTRRTYTFNRDVRRKYMVEVVGMPKASAWVPMTLNCGGLGEAGEKGGFTVNRRTGLRRRSGAAEMPPRFAAGEALSLVRG